MFFWYTGGAWLTQSSNQNYFAGKTKYPYCALFLWIKNRRKKNWQIR